MTIPWQEKISRDVSMVLKWNQVNIFIRGVMWVGGGMINLWSWKPFQNCDKRGYNTPWNREARNMAENHEMRFNLEIRIPTQLGIITQNGKLSKICPEGWKEQVTRKSELSIPKLDLPLPRVEVKLQVWYGLSVSLCGCNKMEERHIGSIVIWGCCKNHKTPQWPFQKKQNCISQLYHIASGDLKPVIRARFLDPRKME